MPSLLRPVCLAVFVLAAGAASADPVIFFGKLNKSAIVVELTGDPASASEPVAGRYFYRSKGVDIPLQPGSAKGGKIELLEEEACPADKCGDGQAAPTAATWTLTVSKDGKTLKGTWAGSRSFPFELTRVAERADAEAKTPYDLYGVTERLGYEDTAITSEASPYDVLRLDVPTVNSKDEGWADARFRYVSDPRTKFPSPRIVSLASGSFGAANELLKQRHWRDSLSAFNCAALQYRGFTESGTFFGSDGGTLGGQDESSAVVTGLTPKLMSWRESGSLFCGGAHPSNYSNSYTMDVAAGTLIGLKDMFADVVDEKPGPSLVAFVTEKRTKPTEQTDIDFETECGTEDLIRENLVGSLERDGDRLTLVFGLQDLPHAIQACGDDMLKIPVADAMSVLTDRFKALLAK